MKRIVCLILSFAATAGWAVAHNDAGIQSATTPAGPPEKIVNGVTLAETEAQTITSSTSIILSDQVPVNVEQNGSMTLVAGKNIVLLPGTKISSGGFLYATIRKQDSKTKRHVKESRLVTVEENEQIEEQTALAVSATFISPFIREGKDHLRSAPPGETAFNISSCTDQGIILEQQRKFSSPPCQLVHSGLHVALLSYYIPSEKGNLTTVCRYVLRL